MATRKPSTRTRSPRATRSQADLATDFENIQSEIENEEALDPVAAQANQQKIQAALSAARDLTIEKAAEKVTTIEFSVNQALSSIRDEIVSATRDLDQVRTAKAAAETDLARLHDNDVVVSSTKALIERHKQTEAELEAAITAKREDWANEIKQYAAKLVEERAELNKERQRDQDEYTYKIALNRREAEDKYAQQQLQVRRQDEETHRQRVQDWTVREENLKARETEFTANVAKIAELTARAEKAEGTVQGLGAQLRDTKHAYELERKGFEQNAALAAQKVASVEAEKATLAKNVVDLTAQLEAARKQIVEIATKTVDGASAEKAMLRVQEVIQTTSNGNQRKA